MLGFKTKNITEFDTLFKKYNSYVFKIVINESNNKMTKEDIEETVSDTFFLLWKNYGKIKDKDKVKSYIATIAKNTSRNKLRSLKQEFSFEENNFSKARDDENQYHVSEQINIVHKELQNMDDIDREIFLMYYYGNKKVREIANIKDMNISTVKTRLHRTKKKLKKILEKGGFRSGR